MLKAILIVTLLSLNLGQTEQAFEDYLGYEVVERGHVSEVIAQSWGADKIAHQPYLLMQPESGENVYLRFIQDEPKNDYAPMRQEGWNAVEILVQDPDALAEKMEDSPFNVVGPPAYLTDKQNIRAFQAIGPDGQLFYFTRIIDPTKSNFDLGQAKSYVDRVFIMVAGSRDMQAMQDFYQNRLGQQVSGPYPYRIGVLSKAYGLPPDQLHPLALAALPSKFLLELDQYPAAAEPISAAPGHLPPGIPMVSFLVDQLPQDLPYILAPRTQEGGIYQGRLSATLRGSAGELIELIQSPAPAEDPAAPADPD